MPRPNSKSTKITSNRSVKVTISEGDYRRLKLWAASHGRTPSEYASQVVAARVEANLDVIKSLLADEAFHQGKSVEELESEWLSTNVDED